MIKALTSFFLFCGLLSAIYSCDPSQGNDVSYVEISEADSTRLMAVLLDSMRQENYLDKWCDALDRRLPEGVVCILKIRTQLNISINEKEQYMVRGKLNAPIVTTIHDYFTANRKKNDLNNIFPMYSRITLKEIEEQIAWTRKDAEQVENTFGANEELIEFKWALVKEWERRKKFLNTLGGNELLELDGGTFIEFDYPENFKRKDAFMDSMYVAYYQMRNDLAMDYFKRSYLSLFYEYCETGDETIAEKLEAIKFIYDIRIADKPYCRKKHPEFFAIPTPPPLPPELE